MPGGVAQRWGKSIATVMGFAVLAVPSTSQALPVKGPVKVLAASRVETHQRVVAWAAALAPRGRTVQKISVTPIKTSLGAPRLLQAQAKPGSSRFVRSLRRGMNRALSVFTKTAKGSDPDKANASALISYWEGKTQINVLAGPGAKESMEVSERRVARVRTKGGTFDVQRVNRPHLLEFEPGATPSSVSHELVLVAERQSALDPSRRYSDASLFAVLPDGSQKRRGQIAAMDIERLTLGPKLEELALPEGQAAVLMGRAWAEVKRQEEHADAERDTLALVRDMHLLDTTLGQQSPRDAAYFAYLPAAPPQTKRRRGKRPNTSGRPAIVTKVPFGTESEVDAWMVGKLLARELAALGRPRVQGPADAPAKGAFAWVDRPTPQRRRWPGSLATLVTSAAESVSKPLKPLLSFF